MCAVQDLKAREAAALKRAEAANASAEAMVAETRSATKRRLEADERHAASRKLAPGWETEVLRQTRAVEVSLGRACEAWLELTAATAAAAARTASETAAALETMQDISQTLDAVAKRTNEFREQTDASIDRLRHALAVERRPPQPEPQPERSPPSPAAEQPPVDQDDRASDDECSDHVEPRRVGPTNGLDARDVFSALRRDARPNLLAQGLARQGNRNRIAQRAWRLPLPDDVGDVWPQAAARPGRVSAVEEPLLQDDRDNTEIHNTSG